MFTKKIKWLNELQGITKAFYDLEKGDFVAPLGKGINKDICFSIEKKRVVTEDQYFYKLIFPNTQDGVLEHKLKESDFRKVYKWPYLAPKIGYQKVLSFGSQSFKASNGVIEKDDLLDSKYLIYRVRTKLNDKGEVISAKYGKIYNLSFSAHRVKFTYYFNPDGTRNLEYDPSQNLFKGRTSKERRQLRVQEP